jgi:hypothetical protein
VVLGAIDLNRLLLEGRAPPAKPQLLAKAGLVPHEIVGRFCETPLYGSASDTDALQIITDCCRLFAAQVYSVQAGRSLSAGP